MRPFRRGGVTELDPIGPAFAPPSERLQGNQLPPWTGSRSGPDAVPGPGPAAGGQVGHYDGASGADPRVGHVQPHPHVSALGDGQETFRRYGIQGFSDRLQVRDRHAYYDRGSQRTGHQPSPAGTPPNNHSDGPARPDLRTVNISVNPQIGSSASRFQDDLARPFTWQGQQDGSISPVYGGVPGLYVPYGTRGGIPYPIQSPVAEGAPGDGPANVWSGPPHGLHSDTVQGGKQVIARYASTPQMRPVRLDRPSNATAAGQSFSQTVPMQGGQQAGARGRGSGFAFHVGGRGWLGG